MVKAITMEKDNKVKGRTSGVYIDLKKFNKLVEKHSSQEEFADTIGRSKAWVWSVRETGAMAKVDALAIKAVHKVDLILPDPIVEEKPKAEIKPQVVVQQNNEDIVKKMDELIQVVNKLGNVQMQILEDVHKISKELVK